MIKPCGKTFPTKRGVETTQIEQTIDNRSLQTPSHNDQGKIETKKIKQTVDNKCPKTPKQNNVGPLKKGVTPLSKK